jgi:6-pyruvoyltetrahydropterin/6-carboxytetrahydropterin synthase
MLTLTKIFHFEMAHAIQGYPGACKNIHGHSYELHVTVTAVNESPCYIPAPGFIIDFKEIKQLVTSGIITTFDHKLLLSKAFLAENPEFSSQENLVTWEVEPTAENMLLYTKEILCKKFRDNVKLVHLKLFETKDSYAEWINDNTLKL